MVRRMTIGGLAALGLLGIGSIFIRGSSDDFEGLEGVAQDDIRAQSVYVENKVGDGVSDEHEGHALNVENIEEASRNNEGHEEHDHFGDISNWDGLNGYPRDFDPVQAGVFASFHQQALEDIARGDDRAAIENYGALLNDVIPKFEVLTGKDYHLWREQAIIGISDCYSRLGDQEGLALSFELRKDINFDAMGPEHRNEITFWKLYEDAEFIIETTGSREGYDDLIDAFQEDRLKFEILAQDKVYEFILGNVAARVKVPTNFLMNPQTRDNLSVLSSEDRDIVKSTEDARWDAFRKLWDQNRDTSSYQIHKLGLKLMNIYNKHAYGDNLFAQKDVALSFAYELAGRAADSDKKRGIRDGALSYIAKNDSDGDRIFNWIYVTDVETGDIVRMNMRE